MFELTTPRTLTFPPAKRMFMPGDYVTFSRAWPESVNIKPGETYQVVHHQETPYDLSYILPADDWKDIDLSNQEATGEKLYPAMESSMFQILIGLKDGNYEVIPYMPQNEYVLGLEHTNMRPDVNDAKRKYLGGIVPSDTPADDPRLKLITLKNMTPFYLRLYVDHGDFEKCVFRLIVNRCKLEHVPNPTEEQKNKRVIRYITEIARRIE